MYLKSLKLVGFKSFADRTRLEFRPGVTVVVGPNGSGKSNIVDAVAWVMGTQSPKSLRTDRMEDVIFAGTATRPGLGRAEVTLIFDNASRTLPLDLDEVAITRRLYRDGSSDYEINGVDCRLLDVQELLSDSGVGRHQHVIIGQGQIDSVLNATPEDHRAVIEEAAGILKHRVRKDKATRRLERSDADVLRLRDLLGELNRQMRPLKRQAEAAGRYEALVSELKELRLFLGGERLRRIDSRRSGITEERTQLESQQRETQENARGLGSELEELTRVAREVGDALDRDTSAAARMETTIERLRRIAQVGRERRRTLAARLEGAGERRRDLENELAELNTRLNSTSAEEVGAKGVAEKAEQKFRGLEDQERSLADQEGMSTEGAIAVVRGDLRSLDAADERDKREGEALDRRSGSVAEQLAAESAEAESVRIEIQEFDALAGEAQERYSLAELERKQYQEEWEAAEAVRSETRIKVAAAEAKVEALEQAARGPFDPEARGIVESSEGVLGSIAQRLDIPGEMAAAVDTALGIWSDAVAFGEMEDVAAAVGDLKSSGRGGVPMVATNVVNCDSIARSLAAEMGVDALVDMLGADADMGLATRLLGDVVLVEGWASAWRIVERHPELRAVTPEGDLVAAGAIRVAHPDGATPAMVETAQNALEEFQTEASGAESRFRATRRQFEEAREVERNRLEELEAFEARMAGATETLARLDRSMGSLRQELERLEERRQSLAEAGVSRALRREELGRRLAALEGEEAERQRMWEDLTRQRLEVASLREAARHEWQEAASAHRALSERRQMESTRRDAIIAVLRNDEEKPVKPEAIARLGAIEEIAQRSLDAVALRLKELRARQADLRVRSEDVRSKLARVRSSLDSANESVSKTKDRLSELAVETADLDARREATEEALRRDADASESEALAAPRPAIESDDLVGELASREAELRRIGPVNPLAAKEYEELSERRSFLSGQLGDLENSRHELRKIIKALEDEIQTRFANAFDEIAAAYQEHFAMVFPGGSGRLVLTDPENPNTSGVDIHAQPLGKKVSKMSLLSGGERSLAALAFLFAIFKARPSPFYILDEVEAALDDANLHRFVRLLEKFRADAQLVIITHQQQTMETADVLYGITMEPGGSSKAVAKRFEDHRAEFREAGNTRH